MASMNSPLAQSNTASLRRRSLRDGAHRRPPHARDDRGAVLILAMVFLLLSVGVVAALSNTAMNDLTNSQNFAKVRSTQYAASSVTEQALQSIRYTPLLAAGETLNASPPSYCWGNGPTSTLSNIDGVSGMTAWCSTAWSPTSALTRTVTISTCLSGVSAPSCALNPLLQAVVTFDDYPPGISGPTSAHCVVYCGTSLTITSWLWSPTVPAVTGISNSSGQITGSTVPTTITGSGFVPGQSTVNFVEESNGSPSSDNTVISVTPATTTTTTITADPPAVTEGSTYFVTVTTPTGTSAYDVVFTYSQIPPTVTSATPFAGSTSGGIAVQITGTGFFSGASVSFVQESGGTVVIGGQSIPASYVAVNSGTSITAVSPSIIIGTTYFVTVTTSAGTSSTTSGAIYTYSLLVPLVSTITPVTGSTITTGTAVTITGTGFFTGARVYFTPGTSCGTSNPASSPTINSSSSISAVAPSLTTGTTYCVSVATGGGTSTNTVTFTAA